MESICFRSTLFEIEPGEDERTNPGRYGRQLAHWLAERLRGLGYSQAEVIPEDWGWCVMCSRKPFRLWVGCGNSDTMNTPAIPGQPDGPSMIWQCFVVAEIPLLKRVFGGLDTRPQETKLHEELLELLSAQREIQIAECP